MQVLKYILKLLQIIYYLVNLIRYLPFDIKNIFYYGYGAPRFAERIFINPLDVKLDTLEGFDRKSSAQIIPGDWDLNCRRIELNKKISIVYSYFDTGLGWERCGAYENMLQIIKTSPGSDGCYNKNDIINRYNKLDDLVRYLKNGGEYKVGSEFREKGSVYIHIGRNGDLIFGGGGCHRLAIAKKLKIKEIPAQIGVVHSDFLIKFPLKMAEMRRRKNF